MIVVSDTTPLNYLILIGLADLLPRLFDDVYVPPELLRELSHPKASAAVQRWAAQPPPWLRVRAPAARLTSTARLDAGEADAISLAREIPAPAVLLDERVGRAIALAEGLIVVRTLALLELAAERGLIQLPEILSKLLATNFRVDPRVIDAALARDAQRRRSQE